MTANMGPAEGFEGVRNPTYSEGHPDAEQYRYKFDNGYGASVIRGPFSYGGEQGKWELAVTRDGHLDYTTPVTDDVEGHLEPADVARLLGQIRDLPAPIAAPQSAGG